MEKVKLSDLMVYYQQKVEKKDEFFKYYFEEPDVEEKLSILKKMYEILGDVTLPLDYFKIFLYSGHWYGNKAYFKLTESMIIDIYDIIKKYDNIPKHIVDKLLYYYDEECFEKCKAKEYFDLLVSKYKFAEEAVDKFVQYIQDSEKKIKDFYLKESEKLAFIRDQYPSKFIDGLRKIILSNHINFDYLIGILPSNTLFKPIVENESEFFAKYNDYRFIFELLRGNLNLDDYKDDDYIVAFEEIREYDGRIKNIKMYTSFTKKEYLENIKERQKIKRK